METKEIIDNLKSVKENKIYKDLTITGVTIGELVDNRQQVSLTLDKEVETITVDRTTGEVKRVMSNVIFITTISAIAVLKTVGLAFAKDDIRTATEKNPKRNPLLVFLSDAKIDIIQEYVKEGKEYVNPFSSNPKPVIFDNERYFSHVIKIELSEEGKQTKEALRRDYLGIAA